MIHTPGWKEACASGDRARVREVATTADVTLLSEMLAVACGHGHLHIAEWLVGMDGVDIHADGEGAFRWACGSGHLDVAKWLVGLGGVDIHAGGEGAFRMACGNGHLHAAQWLVGLGGVDIHAGDGLAFRWACGDGHLVVARWLVGLGGVDIHACDEHAFRWACAHGHLECARVLVDLDPDHAWPPAEMKMLQTWGDRRDAWLKAVNGVSAYKQSSVLGTK